MRGLKKYIIIKVFYTTVLLWLLFACNNSEKQNRLSKASSPYLQQHADNPVDWYEWGEEAITKAKKENKPLLISIGYSSCHWCHVMEKESFMDTAVARIMNENFINIKVDREERPDIDNIYMNACQLISGGGGWPLNAFALPDGKPFFAGTYYAKESWINLLNQITKAYKDQYQKILLQADALTNEIGKIDPGFLQTDGQAGIIDNTVYKNFFDSLQTQIDFSNGGLSGTIKFPMPSVWEFLLQYNYLNNEHKALEAVNITLKAMALGGIYDHIGGGFARYSTDKLWRIPHFEKMLYDNGQLMSLYAHAYQVTKNSLFKNIVEEIALFIGRDLTSPEGGFYSSLNADTEEGEGVFYTWTFDEIKKNSGLKQTDLIASYFNISPEGNWEAGKNILYTSFTPGEFALTNNLSLNDFTSLLNNTKKTLLTERNKRTRPATDDKILASWNALMLKGYLDAYTAVGNEAYLKRALKNARFVEHNMLRKDGQLWRNYKDGKTSVSGFLDDYALLAKAWIRLYQVTFDKHWLLLARQVTDYAIGNFYDSKSGMFYFTPDNSTDPVVRKLEIQDNAIPSSNSVMAEVLFNLSVYFENSDYLEKSTTMVSKISGITKEETPYYTQWYFLAGLLAHGTNEVAIIGKDALQKNLELQKNYLPGCINMGSTNEENLPLLENKKQEDKTLIYVCKNRTCKMPVEDVGKALMQIH